ncbi:MAG: hypothetical protein IK025_07985 [Bacteroidales bacterium]|nr:hypothetical protein [Bacteroidales bacterium]
MNKQEIENIIKSSNEIKDFIEGRNSVFNCNVEGIPISIYKENIGTSYYYRLPWNAKFDYNKVSKFMRYAIPIISKMLENERDMRLTRPDF